MGAGFVPLLKIEVGAVVPLFFLRIALPWLVRLLVRALVGLLTGIVLRHFFAHRFVPPASTSMDVQNGSSAGNESLNFRLNLASPLTERPSLQQAHRTSVPRRARTAGELFA
jgi:hypothetical protein